MITSVELGDFLSHSNTKLDFDSGVTVFVGENGAGKSSIIDGITFALFGQHTRKSNKGLIKRGSSQGFAKVNFVINNKEYLAERKIDLKGSLSARFSEKVNDDWLQIAAGERKQFGESMTQEVQKKIGLDFEKLKIAAIVQQGEINSIIKAKPKEFKELLNSIIGIDKLDIASETMKIINKEFRQNVRNDIGYDDTHIEILKQDLEKSQTIFSESKPIKDNLTKKRKIYENEISDLQSKIEAESPKINKLSQLEERKIELHDYAKEAIQEIRSDIAQKERKIRDCEKCFEVAGLTKKLEKEVNELELINDNLQKEVQKFSNLKASLHEKQSLASKLQLKENKCPVCDSIVDKLNPLFQEEHLKEEIIKIEKQIELLQKKQEINIKKRIELSEKLKKSREAEVILQAHSINKQEDLEKIQKELQLMKTNVNKVPLSISTGNLIEVAQLDSRTKMLFDTISRLEQETKGFNESEFLMRKKSLSEKQNQLSIIDQQLGAIKEKISQAEEKIKLFQNTLKELEILRDYFELLNSIHSNIFNRDGPVATSLRSWALDTISSKASEYLTLLNTKIQRIHLSEKTRNIEIACYSKNQVLDLESLSGGEQVSIALALRLGMANLLGASNLNLIILDEPTTHLDAERRKALVGVMSQLSNISNASMPMQFIIITHDSEIFEDSTVEKIYKFESTEHGSKVTVV